MGGTHRRSMIPANKDGGAARRVRTEDRARRPSRSRWARNTSRHTSSNVGSRKQTKRGPSAKRRAARNRQPRMAHTHRDIQLHRAMCDAPDLAGRRKARINFANRRMSTLAECAGKPDTHPTKRAPRRKKRHIRRIKYVVATTRGSLRRTENPTHAAG